MVYKFLTYMVDKNNNTLKYSSAQRRVESLAKREPWRTFG